MFAVCAVTLLCCMSASHSAPLACEDSVRPLDQLDPHRLEGRWALVGGSLSDPAQFEFFKRRDSSSINFSSTSATSNISYTPSVNMDGKCHFRSYNVSLEGSVLTFDVLDQINVTLTFLHTSCQDCTLIRFDNESKKPVRLLLFSRRREVDQKEMEEFNAQVECLNMPPPAVMDPTKVLCLEETTSDPAAQTEEKTDRQKA
ncbi:uncharacterized protein LOC143318993 [Chaetodon auriga]|uniref:uncharacterized protein LOC143318993 n=1 Tax=Chaetodon auriga TaxID=39042 RepID=UPI004033088D